MTSRGDTIQRLLNELRGIVLPRCVDGAEGLAYMARRDNIVERISEVIGTTRSHETDSNGTALSSIEFISVNQQKLAHDLISRTFDQHKDILRQQLKEAREEAAHWKQIALSSDLPTQHKHAPNNNEQNAASCLDKKECETQTDNEDCFNNSISGSEIGEVLASIGDRVNALLKSFEGRVLIQNDYCMASITYYIDSCLKQLNEAPQTGTASFKKYSLSSYSGKVRDNCGDSVSLEENREAHALAGKASKKAKRSADSSFRRLERRERRSNIGKRARRSAGLRESTQAASPTAREEGTAEKETANTTGERSQQSALYVIRSLNLEQRPSKSSQSRQKLPQLSDVLPPVQTYTKEDNIYMSPRPRR